MTTAFAPRTITIDGLGFPYPTRAMVERWHAGRVSCLNACVTIWGGTPDTLALVGRWHRLAAENADIMGLATSPEEIAAVASGGRVAIVLGFQNTAPVEHNIDLFGTFRDLGVCIMQLTYNLQNYIGCGYWEENDSGISSRFGRKAIEEMNAGRHPDRPLPLRRAHHARGDRALRAAGRDHARAIRANSSARRSTARDGRRPPKPSRRWRHAAASSASRPIRT